jgi:hypothetical protein
MGGYLLHVGATVVCSHSGSAAPITSSPRVSVSGQAIVTSSAGYSVSGCTMPAPTAGNGPCVTASWLAGATRVTAGGVPVLLDDSSSTCTPTETPLRVIQTQLRVRGQ